MALLGQTGLHVQGCGDFPASGEHWSCLDPFGSDSFLSLPVCCQRCSHMPLPCCMRLSYAFMPLRCGMRVCCLHACFEHTSWDTWTACSSRDPLWSPLDLVGPGPRSVPESAVLFSLSFSASQAPSSLNSSFSATSPARERRAREHSQLTRTLAEPFRRRAAARLTSFATQRPEKTARCAATPLSPHPCHILPPVTASLVVDLDILAAAPPIGCSQSPASDSPRPPTISQP